MATDEDDQKTKAGEELLAQLTATRSAQISAMEALVAGLKATDDDRKDDQ